MSLFNFSVHFGTENKFVVYLWLEKNRKKDVIMFETQQYLGFILFLTIFTMGFWLLLFLAGFAFYWITGTSIELLKECKAKKEIQTEEEILD